MNISVIVPVYNVEPYIERCLRSIMSQTFTDGVECILVNDCTPDKSMEIAERLIEEYKGDIQFRIISHEKNRGIAAVRNTGLDAAQGTYIQYIDSDDYVEPDILEKMYKEAVRVNAEIVGCEYYFDWGNCKTVDNSFKFKPSPEYNLQELMNCHYTAKLWRRLIHKSLFTRNHLFFIEGIDIGEDFLLASQLHYYASVVAFVSKPLYNYVQYNSTSLVHSASINSLENSIRVCEFVKQFLTDKGIYERYKIGYLKRCFLCKSGLIGNSKMRDYRYWKSLFPESNQYIHLYGFTRQKLFMWRVVLIMPTVVFMFMAHVYDIIKIFFQWNKGERK